MTPGVIRRQVVLEEHDIAPDGSAAVVVRRFVFVNRYLSHLWLVPLGRGRDRPRQLTEGVVRDDRPRFSPDGGSISFRRRWPDRPDHVRHLMLLHLDRRGEPIALTSDAAYVTSLAWSPDGRRLAFTCEVGPPRFLIGPPPTGNESPLGRRIRRLDWRYDGQGHLDRREHLCVVLARPGARARQLTRGDFGVQEPTWHPDGGSIAFAADRGPEPDLNPRTTIWSVPAGGGELREILALGGAAHSPAFSPNGRWLATVGIVEADALDDVCPGLVIGPADGSGPAWLLAPDLERPIGNWVDTDLNGWMATATKGPIWADDRSIVALVSDRGRCLPWRFTVDPATGRTAGGPAPLVEADAACYTLAVAPRARGGPLVTVTGTLETRAQELMSIEGDRFRTWTTLGSAWQGRARQLEMRRVFAPGDGGPIETWIASPPGAGNAALPTVVDVHGGPLGAWAPTPSLEVALLCGRGYRVVLPNIRGSATYGRAWIRPQLGDWGGADAADVHAALDHVIGVGLADPDRLGVLGLSYGGFMVHWLIGASDRFRAAVSENGVANQVNAWANSDMGVEYNRTSLLGDPLTREGMERLWRQSPLAHVANVRTPLLMFQAEADERCPKADNEQFFTALRVLRREVEYVLYPDEYHVYATTGRPDRRIDRMTRMLDWFDRWLKA